MVRKHHRLNSHEFKQTLGDGEGRGAWCTAVHGVAKSQTQLSVTLNSAFFQNDSKIQLSDVIHRSL